MIDPKINFVFDEHAGLYMPGDMMSGECQIDAFDPRQLKSVEISVLWYTLGKGEEDLSVHYFQRDTGDEEGLIDLETPHRFETQLPNSPLSYDGVIVKICWCVRARVFVRGGREVVDEQPFQLGAVPRPLVVPS